MSEIKRAYPQGFNIELTSPGLVPARWAQRAPILGPSARIGPAGEVGRGRRNSPLLSDSIHANSPAFISTGQHLVFTNERSTPWLTPLN